MVGTVSANRLTGINKLGSCQDCLILSLAMLGLSLVLMGIGGITKLTIVIAIGLFGSAAFGLLFGLHVLFFFLKRKKPVMENPRRCCGQ